MKWFLLPHKQANNASIKIKESATASFFQSWLIKILVYPMIGSLILSGDVPDWQRKTLAGIPSELTSTKVNQIAAKITVKIRDQDFLGSGIIFHQENHQYLVVTNQHVLRAGTPPFNIQTPDGKIYQGEVITPQSSSQDDLALLSFTSDRRKYEIARLGDYSQIQTGELIFAAGFPADLIPTSSPSLPLTGFTFTVGEVAVILDKPLQEGYQIGYTNDVQKGMSGGPLLDKQGRVVGVNGKHAYPLWEAPDFYEDNSQPCEPLQEIITRSSLAIPIEKVLDLAAKTNFAIALEQNDSPGFPQKNSIFSTIATENISHQTMETETISNQHCH